MTALWIGLDVGTTAVKAAAYTPQGEEVAMAEAPSAVSHRPDGGSEQDMRAVWDTACAVLTDLAGRCDGQKVLSLGVAAQGDGLWPLAQDGTPAGQAMLWNDTRAGDDLSALTQAGATRAIGRGCHTALWSGTSGMLWRWLRSHRSQEAAATAHAVTCADWICHRLTGKIATDLSNATIPFLDLGTRRYCADQIAALGCEDLEEKLPAPRRADSVLGGITEEAARRTGLPRDLPVAVGTLDLSAMIVGMGMDRPGQTMMILGTTAVVNILTDRVDPVDDPVGASVLHPISDVVIRVLAPTTGAAAFDWFAGLHPKSLGGASAGEVASRLNEMVSLVPPGSNGVTFLPYLSGERAPFVAPDIRGAFHGLSANTTTADMGRAVLEGAAFSLRHCFEEEAGLPTAAVRLTGGGARNPVWCQIIADVMGQPVLVSRASDHGLWGAAALGAAAAGQGEAIALATRRDETLETYHPTAHARYGALYARYEAMSRHHRALQAELSSLRKDTP